MRLSRRRFLTVSAAALCASPVSAEVDWQGTALGAQAEIRLTGDRARAETALQAARDALARVERAFSLYRAHSELSRLNRTGQLRMSPTFAALVARVPGLHRATDGLFDPSVGALWQAMLGGATGPVGWEKVSMAGLGLHLPGGMALTFNGIAQGFATDRVAATLQAHGFRDVVVDMGEVWVGDRERTIGLPGRTAIRLRSRALSTTAVDALRINGHSHILHPSKGRATWAEATVEAHDATTADAVSTALTLASGTDLAARMLENGLVTRVWLRAFDGKTFEV